MTPQLAHIVALALAHDIRLDWRTTGGCAWPKLRRVSTAKPKSDITYAVALHELGHVLGVQSGRKLDCEIQAWQWAVANASYWSTSMTKKARKSLDSYIAWAERKQRRTHKTFITSAHRRRIVAMFPKRRTLVAPAALPTITPYPS